MARTIYSGNGTPGYLNIGTVLHFLREIGVIARTNEQVCARFKLTGDGLTDLMNHRANLSARCFSDNDGRSSNDTDRSRGFASLEEYKSGFCEELAYDTRLFIDKAPEKAGVLRDRISVWINAESDDEVTALRDKCRHIKAKGEETEEALELIFLTACERNNSGLRKGRKKAPEEATAEDIPSFFSAVDEVRSAVEKIVSNPFLMRKSCENVINDIKNTDSIINALGISGKSVLSSIEGFDDFAQDICRAMTADEKSLLSLVSLFPYCSMDASAAAVLTEKEREAMFALQQRGVLTLSKDMRHLRTAPACRLLMEYTDSYDRHIKSHEQKARELLGMTLKGDIPPKNTAHVLLTLNFDGYSNTEISMLSALLKYWTAEKRESIAEARSAAERLREIAQKEKSRAGGVMDGIIAFAEEVIRIGKEN